MATRKKTSSSAAAQGTRDDERLRTIRRRLARMIPTPECELEHDSPWQLLVATILAAQSTDRTINRVTPALFRRWPTPAALAAAPREEVEEAVKSTGFFRNKARAIQGASQMLVERHGGEVPRDLETLTELPGVARKTANVVLGTALGVASGMPVDTHAGRVARRLELSAERDPDRVEEDLCRAFPKRGWIENGHRLILHGRYVCLARKPRCAACALNEVCPSREADPEGAWTARARAEEQLVAARGEL